MLFTLVSSPASAQQSMRLWKDASGKFELQAKFLRVEGDKVVLEKEDKKIVKVPMEKLSAVDQGFVQGLLAAMGQNKNEKNPFEENPFENMTPSEKAARDKSVGSNSNKEKPTGQRGGASDGAGGEIDVDFEDCPETPIAIGGWDVTMSGPPNLGYQVQTTAVPGTGDIFERLEHTTFNAFAKRAVLSHHLGRPGRRGGDASTRLTVVDIENGKVVANARLDGLWKAMAIDDEGSRIVLRKGGSETNKTRLATVRFEGKEFKFLDEWVPYSTMSMADKEKMVNHVHFINGGRLFTLSQNGRAVIWDFESRTPVRRFNYHGACQPTLSQDRSQLVICGGDLVGVINLDDDSIEPSVASAPQMNYWLSSALSPSGKRFAAATMAKLMVWDLETGDVLFEGGIPGMSVAGAVHFPDEDYVLVNNDKLFDFKNRIKVWQYPGGRIHQVGDQTIFTVVTKDRGNIMPIEIPHEEALTWLKRAGEDSDLFVLKKGAEVAINVNDVPRKFQADVEQALKENMERMGFLYDRDAEVVIHAKIDGPTNEAVRYHMAGNFVVRQFNSILSIQYDGKSIWTSRGNNVPGMVSGNSTAEVKQQLEKAGKSPNIRFFATTNLPEYLQKPGEGSGNVSHAGTLGVTKVGVNGLEK